MYTEEQAEEHLTIVDDEMVKLLQQQQMIIAMKGHPGSGKSTLARAIASALRCPLVDKDDVRDCTAQASFTHLQHHYQKWQEEVEYMNMMNELSYEVIWRIAETQLELGLSVVVDSPLSRRSHLDRLLQLTNVASSSSCSCSRVIKLVIVECRPQDEAEWRRRLEDRGRTIAAAAAAMCDDDGRRKASSSHKPSTWEDLERLMERYKGCWEYDVGDVPKLVLDTTAPSSTVGAGNLVPAVLNFLSSVS